ncbi:prostaglandin E2 receptor EP4 subtype-like [Saccostrea echinata]|uniref:prostaglandin E2 receptor EP4 subtype-like n=1 Tax=Saccostrea echinata TaxID=191078 RepID=UPI002A80380D|nr:prostaglandin E2 receptor EP4 subtype-like [Saccostrea echinata]XP_061183480.1 prostaglandin E2 receptor EP4 subtype-like [Saccostrea echinata]
MDGLRRNRFINMNSSNFRNSSTDIWESAVPPALQFAFGVIGNAIALVVLIFSSKNHQWRPFYRLVCGLAITDGGGILLVYPTVMSRYASNFTFTFPKELCDYSSFIYTFTLISSAMIICAMSFDRFLAILYPFFYNSGNKGRRTNFILALIWLIGLLLSTLHLMGLGSSYNYYPYSWCFLNFVGGTIEDRINSYIYSIFGLLILICTLFLNISVILNVCRKLRRGSQISTGRSVKNDVYIIIFLLVIVVIFTTCWAPLMVVIFSHAASLMETSDIEGGQLELLALRFAVTNSIIDPWIYILLRKETLVGLRKLKRGLMLRIKIVNESIHDNSINRNSERERRRYPSKVTQTGSRTTSKRTEEPSSRPHILEKIKVFTITKGTYNEHSL